MARRNMSDLIEHYLKAYLREDNLLEIRRSDIAAHFDCVPSQINYVINTRFTMEQGYLVESKRGGGGYIRIVKVELTDEASRIDKMMELVGDRISQKSANHVIDTLVNDGIMEWREGHIIKTVLEKSVLEKISTDEPATRAYLLNQLLQQFRIEYDQ